MNKTPLPTNDDNLETGKLSADNNNPDRPSFQPSTEPDPKPDITPPVGRKKFGLKITHHGLKKQVQKKKRMMLHM